MAFVERLIDLSFTLGTGTFGDTGSDTVEVTGLRCSCHIIKAGGLQKNFSQIRVWGVPLSIMNRLSTLGVPPIQIRPNFITVKAGDTSGPLATVYHGTIYNAYVEFAGQPNVCLNVVALAGGIEAARPIPPKSYPGAADAAQMMQDIAASMPGAVFENSGVSVILRNQYLAGTAYQQFQAVAAAANINGILDDQVLAIWPRGATRNSNRAVPFLSSDTGLVGYPSYTERGVSLRCLYNPSIIYGGTITVSSSVWGSAPRSFSIYSLSHDLESKMHGGKWFSDIDAIPVGYAAPL